MQFIIISITCQIVNAFLSFNILFLVISDISRRCRCYTMGKLSVYEG